MDSGLIQGGESTSHKSGNDIPAVVSETGRRFNYEGDEYHLCSAALDNSQIFEFVQKTNHEILDYFYRIFACSVKEGVLHVGDFILCKLVVRDEIKHNRTGTVREILNMMQEENSCRVSSSTELAGGGEINDSGTKPTAEDYRIMEKYPELTKAKQIEIEKEAIKIIERKPLTLTPDEIYTLELFEGIGGQHTKGDVNSLYQFYTPYIWVKKMWELAHQYGTPRSGIKVIEPSMGTGRFFKFAPSDSELIGFDPDKINFEIVKLLYPNVTAKNLEFETNFMKESPFDPGIYTNLLNRDFNSANYNRADLVIGNPPYGAVSGTYASYMPGILNRFENLFIYLGLKCLKPGGLLVYIVSQNFLNNNLTYAAAKAEILKVGEFIDAYRLPNDIFSTTSVGTDIIVFKRK